MACDPAARMAAGASPASGLPAPPPEAEGQQRQRSHRAAGHRELAAVALAALVAAGTACRPARGRRSPRGRPSGMPWNAGPRGLDCSNGQRARLEPQWPRNRIHPGSSSEITTTGGRTARPRPSASSLGSGKVRSRDAGPEVGGVRAVREVGDRRVAARRAPLDPLQRSAPLCWANTTSGARPVVSRPHLHELPVALVAAGVEDPAVLRVVRVPAPVLQVARTVGAARRARRRPAPIPARQPPGRAPGRRGRRPAGSARAASGVMPPRATAGAQQGFQMRERRYKCARSFQVVSSTAGERNSVRRRARRFRVKIEMPVLACRRR